MVSSLFFDRVDRLPLNNLKGLGVGLTALRQGMVLGTTALRRRMLVSLEINNKDRAYEWFLAWMSHQGSAASLAQGSTIKTGSWIRSHQLSVETMIEQRKNGSSSALFKLVAGPGTHWFKYQGAWMQVCTHAHYATLSFRLTCLR
jgi:chaperone BCS1